MLDNLSIGLNPPLLGRLLLEWGLNPPPDNLILNFQFSIFNSQLVIAAIPHTEPWGFNTAFVMIVCNSVAVAVLFLSSYLDGNPALAPKFTLPELLATFSFGHIIGVGMVLGLTSIGTI